MRAGGLVAKVLLGLAALPVGLALLVGLPLGAYALVGFLFREMLLLFVPGVALYFFGLCAPAGLYQWRRKATGAPSGVFRLPAAAWLAAGAAGAVVVGRLLLLERAAPPFWLCFILAAALPPLTALALASQLLGPITSWRRVLAGILSGSLVSTHLTILLGASVSILAYLLVLPLRELVARAVAASGLEQLFYSPALVLVIVEVAIVAPVVEELTKPLAAILLARRLRGPAEAFLIGMTGGVGFAILENMLYEAAGARVWAHIAALRGIGGVLHPLTAGLVALGWHGVRNGLPGAWRRLLGLYGLAVGIHALWNGGLVVLFSGVGAYFFATETWTFDIYGIGQPGVVTVFMVLEAIALWWLLVVVADRLRDPARLAAEFGPAMHLERPERLALWATGLLVPLGALYGPLLARYGDRLLPPR